ncbi:dTMP kinase [Bartonella tamiae]|uniref:Thymidylate kinase n=1 Tax=Bartonella tamiae Th239 TaxID=1094558 RepID=J0ZKF6_9HYPH|nr:dTMP kinase [Bartonella tamiae]EJF88838.1 thymidylate kinase [Bartonella tamiae Th239]EJF94912.1 thymidylate kinase [Bartonella tamiae Th307]
MKGFFITFEGGEGAGKSTQIKALANNLESLGFDVVITREPGGTLGAEAVRHVLLSGAGESYGATFETILFATARLDHLKETIIPALKMGKIVLCDRFMDSTRVYQGLERGVRISQLDLLEYIVIGDYKPDLTFILDVPENIGMERANRRRGKKHEQDRFEKDTLMIQKKRRHAFIKIAEKEKDRCRLIDANQDVKIIEKQISEICGECLSLDRS